MKRFLLLLFLPLSFIAYSQTGILVPEMTHCDTQAINFMNTFNIPGMTYALAKDGKLVYSRAFGNANIALNETTQPHHLFRIASLSKPITSIGIMKMIEDGLISIDDKVFGTGGLLENHWYFSTANITDTRIFDITVQNLLEHTGGWDRNINCYPNPTTPYPWWFSGCDPIVAPLHITQVFGEANPAKEEHLIRFLLEKTLDYDPGTTYAYSNMGFLILSEIIEEVSGLSYEAWMQQQIFNPLGIFDMHIGKNLLADKIEREGEYIGNGFTTKSVYGDGTDVPWEYGGFSLEIMDGHGGWLATARDLVRLLVAVDGFASKPDILLPATITTMTTPSTAASFYAKGWSVNASNNWWHTGALDGTASIFVRTNGGYTWAIILNKRIVDGTANSFWSQLDGLGWNCLGGTTTFPTHDLFESPTVNASNLQASNITNNTMDLSWTNGNGTSRIVIAKETASNNDLIKTYPLDGTDYIANNQFGLGDNLGSVSFVVYNGTGNTMSLQGLNEATDYAIRIYEYTKNTTNGNNALYLLGNATETLESTTTLSIASNELDAQIKLFPNPAKNSITLEYNGNNYLVKSLIYDVNGRLIKEIDLKNIATQKVITLNNLESGVYFMKIYSENNSIVKQILKQ